MKKKKSKKLLLTTEKVRDAQLKQVGGGRCNDTLQDSASASNSASVRTSSGLSIWSK